MIIVSEKAIRLERNINAERTSTKETLENIEWIPSIMTAFMRF